MKKTTFILLIAIVLSFGGGYIMRINQEPSREGLNNTATNEPTISKSSCLADECLLAEVDYPVAQLPENVIEALDQAIMDEYKAYTTYSIVMDKFGNVRPFIMIARAELQHIATLEGIFEKYGVEIPENDLEYTIQAPGSIQEACALGVQGEVENVKLYNDSLLPAVTNYEDITIVFTNLMNASEQKHLPAFKKCD